MDIDETGVSEDPEGIGPSEEEDEEEVFEVCVHLAASRPFALFNGSNGPPTRLFCSWTRLATFLLVSGTLG